MKHSVRDTDMLANGSIDQKLTNEEAISLAELAKKMLEEARILESHIPSPPTFANDTLSNLPPELEPVRRSLIETSKRFSDLVRGSTGPFHRLGELLTMTHPDQMALKFIYRFRVPQAVPISDTIAFSDLAAKCNVERDKLTRILRYAMTFHVFCEPKLGFVAHTTDSRLLAVDPSVFDYLGASLEDFMPASHAVADAMIKWPNSENPGQCGFSLANNTQLPMYEYLKGFPERTRRFGAAMAVMGREEGETHRHLVNCYPWEQLGSSTVVDVGGGNGHLSQTIARAHPQLTFVIQDLPEVVKQAEEGLPLDLRSRFQFSAHDFFVEQPAHHPADVYFFSQIMHNWDDNHWLLILRALIPALKSGTRILVCDKIIPERGTMSLLEERKIRGFDVKMLAYFNGRERPVSEVVRLFQQADVRFSFQGVWRLESSLQVICEAIWNPQ